MRGLLCDQMLKRRPFSLRHRPGPKASPEIDECKRKENRRHIEEQAKPLRRRFRGCVQACELRARLLQRRPGLNSEQALESVVDIEKKHVYKARMRNDN